MVEEEHTFHANRTADSGIKLIMGEGRFAAPKTIEVSLNDGGIRRIVGERMFLNLGSHLAIPNIPGLIAANPMTNIEAPDLDYLPRHLVVIGGGYVGLEFAQAMRRFGSEVTVIGRAAQLTEQEDPDVAAALLNVILGPRNRSVARRAGLEGRGTFRQRGSGLRKRRSR